MAPLELQRHIINTLAGHEHFGPPALPLSEVTREQNGFERSVPR
jgi:hypothetical protein